MAYALRKVSSMNIPWRFPLRAFFLVAGPLGSFVTACGGEVQTSTSSDATVDRADERQVVVRPDASDAGVPILGSTDGADVPGIPNPPPTEPPDAACGSPYFETVADGGPSGCAFTASDVACDADTDCVPYVVSLCCVDPVRGVNKTSTAVCVGPPCPPPHLGSCPGYGFETQDCKLESDLKSVGVACVHGECVSYAAM
jgi:hypothetical protein